MSKAVGCVHLASLVLGDLVLGVLLAVPGLAVRPAGFWNVDLVVNQPSSGQACCWLLVRVTECEFEKNRILTLS